MQEEVIRPDREKGRPCLEATEGLGVHIDIDVVVSVCVFFGRGGSSRLKHTIGPPLTHTMPSVL